MSLLILMSPLISIMIFIITPTLRQAFFYSIGLCLFLSGIDFWMDVPTHAHNPLGRLSGTFMLFVFNAPVILVCTVLKDVFGKKIKSENK